MMRTFIFLLSFLCVGVCASAQKESDAKQISKIQKDKHYIWAEGIDTTEIQANKSANEELLNRINEYIIESGMAEETKEIVVKNINQLKNEIKMSRGGLYRVFLYVRQKDIVESSSPVKVITIEQAEETQTEEAPVAPVQAEAKKQKVISTPAVQNKPAQPVQKNKEAQDVANIFSSLSASRLEVIQQLAAAKDLKEANKLLEKHYNYGTITNYGTKKDCKDENGCYWVVPADGGVTVLSKLSDGQRWNYRTGKTDSLQNYTSGLWVKL